MAVQRVFYGSQGVKVNGTVVQGAQSVSINSTFALAQAFQLGQTEVYDNVVTNEEVTCTISKVLDGEATIWHLSTSGGTGGSLIEHANDQSTVLVGFGDDADLALSSDNNVEMTGMYVSSVNYTMPVDGLFTEEVGFAGFTKTFGSTPGAVSAPSVSGNIVLRRQNFIEIAGAAEVEGMNLTNVTISADLGRTNMFKLKSRGGYHKFANFPFEVKCDVTVTPTGHDNIPVAGMDEDVCTSPSGMSHIVVTLCQSNSAAVVYSFDLGDKCRLTSANYSGGDTGGGNATITYSYVTYNALSISG